MSTTRTARPMVLLVVGTTPDFSNLPGTLDISEPWLMTVNDPAFRVAGGAADQQILDLLGSYLTQRGLAAGGARVIGVALAAYEADSESVEGALEG